MSTTKAPIPHKANKGVNEASSRSAFKPSCPGLYVTELLKADYVERDYDETAYTAAQCTSLSFNVECHLSTAFVTVSSTWVVPRALLKGKDTPCAFACPLNPGATVTSITAKMKKKRIASCVVPVADTGKFRGRRFGRDNPEPLPTHPEVFAINIPNVKAGETVDLEVTYFEPLSFVDGAYIFEAPSTLPDDVGSGRFATVVSFLATVRSAFPGEVPVQCTTHPVSLVQKGSGVTQIQLDGTQDAAFVNRNVVLRMPVWADHIAAAAVQQPAAKEATLDTRSTFAIAVAPPKPEHCAPFPRSVIFLVDRSGSMAGGPMESANEAVVTGLKSLTQNDKFNIVAFDNLQVTFNPEGLVEATPDAVNAAISWIGSHCVARGTTDIMTPLQASLRMLATSGAPSSVPFVFLITDGAVENEREICKVVQEAHRMQPVGGMVALPRVCTFGIGRFCNHYFLKMLANIGRGLSDAAFTPNRIVSQMKAMLAASRAPVLTNVMIGIDGKDGVPPEIYPFPIPDLFVGAPIMISGKIQGGLPPTLEVKGRLADGTQWSNLIQVVDDLDNNLLKVPLDKVFIKQRIDLLTAKAWLQREKVLEKEVVAISVRYGVPCAHTKLCAFETTASKHAKMESARKSGKPVKVAAYAVGGVGGVLALGSLAGAGFGDVGASMANVGSNLGEAGEAFTATIASLDFDIPDLDCFDSNPCCDAVEPCVNVLGEGIEIAGTVIGVLWKCVTDMIPS